jgi:hypothetical protein
MKPGAPVLKALFAATLALTLGACGTSGPYKRMSDGSTTVSPDNGVLVFSSLKDNEHSIMWDYVIASSATQEYGTLGREFRLPKGFYDLPCGRLGNVIAASLKPGDYTFGPWTLDVAVTMPGVGYMVTSSRSSHGPVDARIPFSIRAGTVTYVGEVHVDEAGDRAKVSDDWECDQPYVRAKWPVLDAWPVTKSVAPFPDAPSAHASR